MRTTTTRILIAAIATVLLAGCASTGARRVESEARALTAPSMRRFEDEAALRRFLADAEELRSGVDRYRRAEVVAMPAPVPVAPPSTATPSVGAADDAASASLDSVQVTGSRIGPDGGDTITNNQEAGVDEGDIVKKSGDFVFILGNGMLTVVRIAVGGMPTLAVTDRLVVDEDGKDETWFDEILAQDGRLVLLGYHFGAEEASELRVFDVDAAGRLARRGRFWFRSGDYYDSTNYGARLHDGHLVISTTLPLDAGDELAWPEWSRRDVTVPRWQPVVRAEDLYWPVYVGEDDLAAHVVLRCPLQGLDGERLDCRATGIVGAWDSTLYVGQDAAWLAVAGLAPDAFARSADAELDWIERQVRTAVFRIPHDGAPPSFATAEGFVEDQFHFDERGDGGLRLATQAPAGDDWRATQVRLYDLPGAAFASRRGVPSLPAAQTRTPFAIDELRFARAGLWLAGTTPGRGAEERTQLRLLRHGGGAVDLPIAHRVEQLQPLPSTPGALATLLALGTGAGGDVAMSLYGDHAAPSRVSTLSLPGRATADDRSHALNLAPRADGTTLLGLPTQGAGTDWDTPSDLDFFELAGGRLAAVGLVAMQDQTEPPCPASCTDWYGDSRVFFLGARVFALSGNLLKEARRDASGMTVVRRVELIPSDD